MLLRLNDWKFACMLSAPCGVDAFQGRMLHRGMLGRVNKRDVTIHPSTYGVGRACVHLEGCGSVEPNMHEIYPTAQVSNLMESSANEINESGLYHSPVTIAAPNRFCPDGVDVRGEHLPRTALVEELHSQLKNHRFVYIGAPAATGKTSLLTLYKNKYPEVNCVYMKLVERFTVDDQLLKIGIDAKKQTIVPWSECYDYSKPCVVMLDDAHTQFHDHSFWEGLVKGGGVPGFGWLPNHIHFAIAATSTLAVGCGPAVLRRLTTPGLSFEDFQLSPEEVAEFLSFQFTDSPCVDILGDPTVRTMLAKSCGGHIGALSSCVHELLRKFRNTKNPSVQGFVSYFLSNKFLLQLDGCFADDIGDSEQLRELLREVHLKGSTSFDKDVLEPTAIKTLQFLVSRGTMYLNDDFVLRFSCPLAARFVVNKIYPDRDTTSTEVCDLMVSVIESLSGNAVSEALSMHCSSKERPMRIKKLLFEGLVRCTGRTVSVIPDLATLCGEDYSYGADFYINGDEEWAIKVVFVEKNLHSEKGLETTCSSKYDLPASDFLVVDVKVCDTRPPSHSFGVDLPPDQLLDSMSVIFYPAYSQCAFRLCGYDQFYLETFE